MSGGTIRAMSAAAVEDVLARIRALTEAERDLLERRLDEQREAERQRLAAEARREARRCGVDQAAIDRAVEEVRYGISTTR